MKKFYISIVPVLFLSLCYIPSVFCELDPELQAYTQRVNHQDKDYFIAFGFAVGPNKLTSKTDLGISYAGSIEFGFFDQIGSYNSFHLGIEYSFLKNTYETGDYEDEMMVPVRLLPKVGYGLILSERICLYLNGGIGAILAKQKRTLKDTIEGISNSNESSYALGYAFNLAVETNIKLHGSLSLNVGFRADLLNVEPSEYSIQDQKQVNGNSTTTIAYSMNAGLKISL